MIKITWEIYTVYGTLSYSDYIYLLDLLFPHLNYKWVQFYFDTLIDVDFGSRCSNAMNSMINIEVQKWQPTSTNAAAIDTMLLLILIWLTYLKCGASSRPRMIYSTV